MNQPDYTNIVNAALNKKTARIPLYEHIVSPRIMEKITGESFAALFDGNYSDKAEFFKHYAAFFAARGYDTASFECCAGAAMPGSGSLGGHKEGVIQNRKDFERYPWDTIPDMYFNMYRETFRAFGAALASVPGLKGIGGVGNGVFECVQDITGFESLCLIKADDEDLYRELFVKAGEMLYRIWERFLPEFGDLFCVARFGDDLGYKSNTLLSAEDIRENIIPQYKKIIALIHKGGKPFLLHSCGCIFNVMDDIIAAGIDAKHSNEDVIAPYAKWIDSYGDRIGNFGGLDTDVLCASSQVDLVPYVTKIYKLLEAKGHGAAIGSGNSIPDYVDPARYALMTETVCKLRQQ